MMTINELAERWGVSLRDAKQIVRDEKVPFIALRTADMRINWTFVRFEPEAVDGWERGRERVFPQAPPPQPRFIAGRRLRRS